MTVTQNTTAAELSPRRKMFHTIGELPAGEIEFAIEGILPEGISAIGSLSGVGKSLLAFSMCKALTTGKPFLGVWNIPQKMNVLYLCPEMGGKQMRHRAEKFGILNDERFLCTTMKDGAPKLTGNALLKEDIQLRQPVIFLDTAIRFTDSDENSSTENANGLAKAVFNLLNMGAKYVVLVYHSPKYQGKGGEMLTLENVLRGTGDIGAMCDCVWGLQFDHGDTGRTSDKYAEESHELSRILVKNVKPRDIEPAAPFRIQGRPYINDTGDFMLLVETAHQAKATKLGEIIAANPTISLKDAAKQAGISRNRVAVRAKDAGWLYGGKGKPWTRTEPSVAAGNPDECPAPQGVFPTHQSAY